MLNTTLATAFPEHLAGSILVEPPTLCCSRQVQSAALTMAARRAPGISRTSRTGPGRICNSLLNTPVTPASMVEVQTMTGRAVMRARTTRSIWTQNSFFEKSTQAISNTNPSGEKRNEIQDSHIGNADRRDVHRSLGRRYRGQS